MSDDKLFGAAKFIDKNDLLITKIFVDTFWGNVSTRIYISIQQYSEI
ncbi:hypothetical protein LC593_01575 [Nostoc sp. CHAB 5844]|nr:hypothetical protein [Nostoc sp. CHAB 5844]